MAEKMNRVKVERVLITHPTRLEGKELHPQQEYDVPAWFARRLYRSGRARPVPAAAPAAAPAAKTTPAPAPAAPVKKEANDG